MERSTLRFIKLVERKLTLNPDSTVAVAVWALSDTPVSPQLQLEVDGVYDGGVGSFVSKSPTYSELRA